MLMGCSSGNEDSQETEEQSEQSAEAQSEDQEQSEAADEVETDPEAEAATVMKEEQFDIGVRKYAIKIPETWTVLEDEDTNFSAETEDGSAAVVLGGMSKEDIESLEVFASVFKEEFLADETIAENTQVEEEITTNNYSGQVFIADFNVEGILATSKNLFLETSEDYVLLSLTAQKSFFTDYADIADEIINSFTVVQ